MGARTGGRRIEQRSGQTQPDEAAVFRRRRRVMIAILRKKTGGVNCESNARIVA